MDACAGQRLVNELRQGGHDVALVENWQRDPGEDEILETAKEHYQIVITRDKDFGTLAVRDKRPHCGIRRAGGTAALPRVGILSLSGNPARSGAAARRS